jgi:predicted dehydrogenase
MLITRRSSIASLASVALGSLLPAVSAAGAENRIRIGQIGTSHSHAAGKMEAIRSLPELFEVIGAAEANAQRREAAARTKAFAELEWKGEADLIATPGLQAVVVETSLAESASTALRVIRAGKHVHLDKPGAANHADFKAMREEAKQRGVTVQMGYMLRYNPAFELLFRATKEGWLGEITEVDASMGKLAADAQRTALQEYPGGGMFELGCHLIDAVITILGKPMRVHAFSKATRAPSDDFPDNQMAVLEYPKATATLRCNHADPFGGPRRRFFVAGTKGSMEIAPLESGKATLYLSEPPEGYAKGQQSIALKLSGNRYADEFRDLATVIRGEKKFGWSAAHDIAVHESALRAAGAWTD